MKTSFTSAEVFELVAAAVKRRDSYWLDRLASMQGDIEFWRLRWRDAIDETPERRAERWAQVAAIRAQR